MARGVKQGCPMSSALFVVGTAILSRMLAAVQIPMECHIYHRAYIDDFAFVTQMNVLPVLHGVLMLFVGPLGSGSMSASVL